MEVVGFHGTYYYKAEKIIREKHFTYTKRPDHWLGWGIYFYINDFSAADLWVKRSSKYRKAKTPKPKVGVLKNTIKVDEKNLLDLDSRDGLQILEDFIKEIESAKLKVVLGDESKNVNTCQIINLLDDDIHVVKRTFSENPKVKAKYARSINNCFDVVQTQQLCIRDMSIFNYETLSIC
ncbi:hypothetical protein K9J90_001035 [Listeria innocua]|uniref:hypothetical protein n=1 Tax=Listeria innocua TaxID=1642 RepID=UPI0013877C96|nr:hypothetical protein [Listeria innocua]HAM1793042.1 hypothetical protein [Listeria monocytogenes]EDO1152290.1 hypothetical protein [Listeria innocua]EIB7809819.1 hypothetical protein [Listeria innocua]EIB7898216.1 hypothetical protein [Listeria innocua]EJH3233610.1 hypothetical protein [Listeria innocua]